MNDEIKGILAKLEKKCFSADTINISFRVEYMQKLLDYITTLQEEKQRLREHILRKDKVYSDLEDKYIELKEENETLKELNVCVGCNNNPDYKARIDKANKILGQILVVRDWEHKGRFRPVKNTTRQEVYATIVMLNELLETPYRASYGLLQGDDNNAKD